MDLEATTRKTHYHRLNLIFHGLMAFWDRSKSYDVLIPKLGLCHEAMFGNPLDLRKLDASQYSVEGINPSSAPDKPKRTDAIVLRQGLLLDPVWSEVRTIVSVPKPDKILHFRGAKVGNNDLAGNDPETAKLFLMLPTEVSEVTVFSYLDFSSPYLLDVRANRRHAIRPHRHDQFWNLSIYCQPSSAACEGNDSGLFNAMFTLKSNGLAPKVNAFMPNSYNELPVPTSPDVGIEWWEELSLDELPLVSTRLQSDPGGLDTMLLPPDATLGGCLNGFVCGDDSAI